MQETSGTHPKKKKRKKRNRINSLIKEELNHEHAV